MDTTASREDDDRQPLTESRAPSAIRRRPRLYLPGGPRSREPAPPLEVIGDRPRDRSPTPPFGQRERIVLWLLLAADALAIVLAFAICSVLFSQPPVGRELETAAAAIVLIGLLGRLDGLYGRDAADAEHTTADELVGIFRVVTLANWLLVGTALATGSHPAHPRRVVAAWVVVLMLIPLMRMAARAFVRRRRGYLQRTLIVGAGAVGQMLAEKIIRNTHMGMNLVGFVDGSPLSLAGPVAHIPVLGGSDRLPETVREHGVERVVIAFSDDSLARTLDIVRTLNGERVQIDIVPRLFEAVGPTVRIHSLEGIPLVGFTSRPRAPGSRGAKRAFDLVLGAALLVVLAPVMAIVALAIRLDSPGPVLYVSQRIGREGRRFRLRKFRTMRREASRGARYGGDDAERQFAELMSSTDVREEFERTRKLRNDPRVTRVGAFLRRTSLDELPQLINVISGDLSIVGPRPITAEEFEQFFGHEPVVGDPAGTIASALAPERLPSYWELGWVLPGITGYWQITGRSSVDYQERLRLDWTYAMNRSLKLDLLILAKTLGAIGGRDAF